MPLALFGITNEGLNLAVNLLVFFLVVVYLVLIAWTYFDARRRIDDGFLVACATATSLFPFIGSIIYSILRPPEYLDDKRERELEIRATELRVRQLEESSCPNCAYPIERSYLRCPNCRARVKDPCQSCGKPIDPRWSVCPYCEAPVQRAAPPARRPAAAGEPRPARRSSGRAGGRKPSRAAAETQRAAPAPGRTPRTTSQRQASKGRKDGTGAPVTGEGRGSRSSGREASGEDRPRPATT